MREPAFRGTDNIYLLAVWLSTQSLLSRAQQSVLWQPPRCVSDFRISAKILFTLIKFPEIPRDPVYTLKDRCTAAAAGLTIFCEFFIDYNEAGRSLQFAKGGFFYFTGWRSTTEPLSLRGSKRNERGERISGFVGTRQRCKRNWLHYSISNARGWIKKREKKTVPHAILGRRNSPFRWNKKSHEGDTGVLVLYFVKRATTSSSSGGRSDSSSEVSAKES